MSLMKFTRTSVCIAALFAATGAQADVTPEQVWEAWKSMSVGYGQTLTTDSETREGDSLVVRGLTNASSNDGVTAQVTVDQVTFTDKGDGTVAVSISETSKMTVRTPGEAEKPEVVTHIDLVMPGLETTVAGTPDEMRFDFTGPSLTARLAKIEGVSDVPADLKAEAVITGLSGNYLTSGTTAKTITSNFSATALNFMVTGSDADNNSKIDMRGGLAGLSGVSTAKLPEGVADMADPAAALRAGSEMEGTFSYQAGNFDSDVTADSGPTTIRSTSGGGDLTFAMDAARLAYGATGRDARVTITGASLPVPEVALAYDEGAFNLQMPVTRSDEPGQFAFLTRLVGLTISDDLWNLFDAGKQLPRDPMTLVLDTSGTAKLNVDLLDETAVAGLTGAPGELHSLDLNALQLTMAGAELTGTGALTFDNTDTTTYDGIPAPTGEINLKATGVNGLLDALTNMGLLPQDQVMGARMMLGMFAKVVEDQPDTLTSDIEFKGPNFFINGMQLQ